MKTVLSDKTQYHIVNSALTSGGEREKRQLTDLVTNHQMTNEKAQRVMTEYTSHPAHIYHAMLDHQPHISSTSLYHIALGGGMPAVERNKLHNKLLKRNDLEKDHLETMIKHGNKQTINKVVDHPKADWSVHQKAAIYGDHTTNLKLLKHADDYYVRNALISTGNHEIHHALMDAGHHDAATLKAIHNKTKTTPEVKERAMKLLMQQDIHKTMG